MKVGLNNPDKNDKDRYTLNTTLIGVIIDKSVRHGYIYIDLVGYCSYAYDKHALLNNKTRTCLKCFVDSKFVVKVEDIYTANGTLEDRDIVFKFRSSNIKMPIRYI